MPETPIATPVAKKPPVVLFLAQPHGALVGDGKPFKDVFELCRWARNECGYEAVTVPAGMPFVDIRRVNTSTMYRDDIREKYVACGTPLLRLEAHVIGQRMLLHPAQLARFRGFAPPEFKSADHRAHENQAETEMLAVVEATHRLGFKDIVDFSGNRAWCAAKYPWNAYPPLLRLYVLLLILNKHRRVLARCAQLGIRRCFELHPESDLNSPFLLYLLRELARVVAPETVPAIKANGDASHETLAGGKAGPHFIFLKLMDLLGVVHLKDAEVQEETDLHVETITQRPWLAGGSIYGDYAPRWSESLRRFCIFGTGQAPWEVISPIILDAGVDLVVEAECSKFPNMMQGLKIGAENALLMRARKPLLDWRMIAPEAPDGDNWETFCQTNHTAEELLYMQSDENQEVEGLIKKLDPDFVKKFF